MKKLLLMMITLPSMVFATGWSFGYADVNFDDIGLGGVYGSYDWEVGENISVESGIIFGTKDYAENGSYGGVSYAALAELDPSAFVKAKYHVNDTFFANISLCTVFIFSRREIFLAKQIVFIFKKECKQ